MTQGNTYIFQITGTGAGRLADYPMVDYKDGYFFKNVDLIGSFNFPTSTFGGPLTSSEGINNPSLTADGGVVFGQTISGGPMFNYTYFDFSALNTDVDLGLFYCTPVVNISLSGFDESVSRIVKIVYQKSRNDLPITLNSQLSVQTVSANDIYVLLTPKNNLITFNFSPEERYIATKTSFLSVFRLDNTINTLTFRTSVAQCGVLDLYDSANIINSQILDESNYVLLTLENKTNKSVYNSIINTDIPFYLLSGGDVVELENLASEPQAIFDLDSAAQTPAGEFQASQIRQVGLPEVAQPKARINPVTPLTSEYYYRGVRGIRIRPLLAKLLPGERFYYAVPDSGLIITAGGAPYLPGLGISFDVRFRVL
jgi:hypothetical protein